MPKKVTIIGRLVTTNWIAVGLLLVTQFTAPDGRAQSSPSPATISEQAISSVALDTETYIVAGMKTFDDPGLAIGIVANDKLLYAKGFGVRGKAEAQPVDSKTVFQIGSTTKAFLAATMAIMVDRGKLRWDDRVVDLDPDFRMKDPWVTGEFRIFDLLAQRSGLPPYANDALGLLGIGQGHLIRSLRDVEPVSSFRTTFAYTNITHMLAGRVVAKAAGASDWNAVLQKEIFDRLAMKESSYTAAAIEAGANHANGHRWSPSGAVEVPFTQLFPYDFEGAGDINSTIEDASHWLRLQLGNGTFEGQRVVSPENLTVTHTPKVAMSDKVSYAMGWVVQQTPNGTIIWHNGGTSGFGAYIGFVPDKNVGVVVLTNEDNQGFPDAVGRWVLDRILGNPNIDHAAAAHRAANTNFETAAKLFAKPEHSRPFPPLAPLTGDFANPSFGKATVTQEGEGLLMTLATEAKLRLELWDGGIFTAKLLPTGRFAPVEQDMGPLPTGFVELQMDKAAKLNVLHLSFSDGQAYDFVRQ